MPAVRFFEKRKHPRFPLTLKCTFAVAGHSADAQIPAIMINASAGGAQLHYDSGIMPGERLNLTFPAPLPPVMNHAEVTVVWVRKNAINLFGHYAAGVKFQRPSEDLLRDILAVGEKLAAA
jgi:hypothetical protein